MTRERSHAIDETSQVFTTVIDCIQLLLKDVNDDTLKQQIHGVLSTCTKLQARRTYTIGGFLDDLSTKSEGVLSQILIRHNLKETRFFKSAVTAQDHLVAILKKNKLSLDTQFTIPGNIKTFTPTNGI